MIDRRRFSFGALLAVGAAASSTARAEGLTRSVSLGATYQVNQRRHVLEVRLVLVNQSAEAIEVQSLLGSRPGPRLEAHRIGAPDGEMLAEIVKFDRNELMSRMGPPPTYVAVAPRQSIEVGPYKFETPEGPVQAVELRLTAYTDRDVIELPPQIVHVGASKAV